MMHKQIKCPTCGNVTTAKSIQEPQKCQWCRRLFKITITKRNTNSKKNKFSWSAELIDSEEDHQPKRRPSTKTKNLKLV